MATLPPAQQRSNAASFSSGVQEAPDARGLATSGEPFAGPSPACIAIEHSRGFHRLVKRCTGSEGQMSYLKRGSGWDRTASGTRILRSK
jgi:hypothetical protein